jgi:hypothetical protein
MRLVTAGTRREWVWLEPETPAEATATRNCFAQGEWTNGRGSDAIPRLRALSARLGVPGLGSDSLRARVPGDRAAR